MNASDSPPEVLAMAKRLFHAQNPNGKPWEQINPGMRDKYVRLICASGAADLFRALHVLCRTPAGSTLEAVSNGQAALHNLIAKS